MIRLLAYAEWQWSFSTLTCMSSAWGSGVFFFACTRQLWLICIYLSVSFEWCQHISHPRAPVPFIDGLLRDYAHPSTMLHMPSIVPIFQSLARTSRIHYVLLVTKIPCQKLYAPAPPPKTSPHSPAPPSPWPALSRGKMP